MQTITVINLPLKVLTLETLVTFAFKAGRMTSTLCLQRGRGSPRGFPHAGKYLQARLTTSHSVKFIPFPAFSTLVRGKRDFQLSLLSLLTSLTMSKSGCVFRIQCAAQKGKMRVHISPSLVSRLAETKGYRNHY